MALGALPQNIPHTFRHLWKICDDIWFVAGDTSLNYSWYGRRSSLLAVYTATDKSDNFKETWRFLDRRLDNALSIGHWANTAAAVFDIASQSGINFMTILKGYPHVKPENDLNNLKNDPFFAEDNQKPNTASTSTETSSTQTNSATVSTSSTTVFNDTTVENKTTPPRNQQDRVMCDHVYIQYMNKVACVLFLCKDVNNVPIAANILKIKMGQKSNHTR
eukprot:TRINITY_DN3208_c0_g1_i8.p1 TRINITY_DN3208_c0_g1~~TRINITY_DN3208_c0_g1_i8.p1  ORF type:complete len:219 (+),score=-11.88 TRINITY_DN3208_c0_g1_i8:70-726(+)